MLAKSFSVIPLPSNIIYINNVMVLQAIKRLRVAYLEKKNEFPKCFKMT